MITWFHSKNRKPMVVRGARQVGKSTLIRSFAEHEKLQILEINLEKQTYLEEVFAKLDTGSILRELSNIGQNDLTDHSKILLFLDEIQATPSALKWLRYAYEEIPKLAIIALEFAMGLDSCIRES